MAYKLNNIDLTTYGMFPSRADGSNLAISGCWDLPSRINTTSHDWGDENGIEPYVEEGQIFFGGRDITLTMFVNATDKNDCLVQVMKLYRDIDAYSNLVVLSTNWGDFNVYVSDAISVNYVRNGKGNITLKFREPVCDLSGTIIEKVNYVKLYDENNEWIISKQGGIVVGVKIASDYNIDGYSFGALGAFPLSLTGIFNRPNIKAQQFKSYETEGFQITRTAEREDVLTCLVVAKSYTDFQTVIKNLYALFTAPGIRTLNYFNDAKRYFFVKDGFQVTKVFVKPNVMIAQVSIKICEVGVDVYEQILISTNKGILKTIDNSNVAINKIIYATQYT